VGNTDKVVVCALAKVPCLALAVLRHECLLVCSSGMLLVYLVHQLGESVHTSPGRSTHPLGVVAPPGEISHIECARGLHFASALAHTILEILSDCLGSEDEIIEDAFLEVLLVVAKDPACVLRLLLGPSRPVRRHLLDGLNLLPSNSVETACIPTTAVPESRLHGTP